MPRIVSFPSALGLSEGLEYFVREREAGLYAAGHPSVRVTCRCMCVCIYLCYSVLQLYVHICNMHSVYTCYLCVYIYIDLSMHM